MTTRQLTTVESNADLELLSFVPRLAAPTLSRGVVHRVCRAYRRRGIARFFMTGDAAEFLEDLQKSGTAYLYFLRRAAPGEIIVSKSDPLFDAICAWDLETAQSIAAILDSVIFLPGEEYEDDYLFILFLIKRFFTRAADGVLGGLIDRMVELCDGKPTPRVRLCGILSDRSPEEADPLAAILSDRIDEYDAASESLRAVDAIVEEDWTTTGQLFIEGLAVIRLVERRLGIEVPQRFRLIPSLARRWAPIAYGESNWRTP